MKMKRRIVSICMCMMMVFAMAPLVPYGGGTAFAADIPAADVTYTAEDNWDGTLEISESKTVKLMNVTHDNNGTAYDAAIRISGGSTVNLVFEGDNYLAGNNNKSSSYGGAGIEVENGSTVNIYGTEDATLTATGGMLCAGIGGAGYDKPLKDNAPAGNIRIYSGTITAIGGTKGAGIGSGRYSSASEIEILGGNVTALGTGGGAGIGAGVGSNGGAQAAGSYEQKIAIVGFYHGGNITISGGKVFAAGYDIDQDELDIYDTETLYCENYDSYAAGIGGGHCSSSGNIVINDAAEVTAIGGCGGAGIGAGRGTSDKGKYDAESFNCSVTIGGNAKVNALTTDDRRTNVTGDDGAAAIGLGRGCTLQGTPKGTVVIDGNAEVYAVGASHAAAIGGSTVVGRYETTDFEGNFNRPYNATLATLTIGSGATVTAVSDGYRPAVDPNPANFVSLNADEQYFETCGYVYTEDAFPLRVDTVKAGSTGAKTTFAVQRPGDVNVMVHVPNIDKYSFLLKDYLGFEGEKIYLSNDVETNSAQFLSGSAYDLYGLTARLDRNLGVDSKYGTVDVKMQAAEGIFEYGSMFFAGPAGDDAGANLDKAYNAKLGRVLFLEAGVMDPSEEICTQYQGGKPVLSIQLPKGWDKARTQALLVNAGTDKSFAGSQKITSSGGKTYVSFETTRGGTFALLEQKAAPAPKPTPAPKPAPAKVSGTPLPTMTAKGDNTLVIAWSKVKGVSGYDIFFARCDLKGKKTVCKKVKTIKGNKTFKWTRSGLSKGIAYKAVVKAYVTKKGKKTYVRTSPMIHAYTSGGTKNYTNARSVTVNTTGVALNARQTYQVKAGVTKLQKGKKLMPSGHAPKLRYYTSNKKIATVSKSGKIRAKAKGSCKIYVVAVNGASKTISVAVK